MYWKLTMAMLGLAISIGVSAKTLVTVNGVPITSQAVQVALNARPAMANEPDAEKAMLAKLVAGELLVQDAQKRGLDQHADVKRQIRDATRQILADAAINQYLARHPITEKDIKTQYDKWAKKDSVDYHTRHILVSTEKEAQAIRDRIKTTDDFAKEAKAYSMDKLSGARGGDLGWISATKLVSQYVDAVRKLKPGEISQPVHTFFGWHIIQLLGTRPDPVPALTTVRQYIIQQVTTKRINAYLAQLRARAQITSP